jgi:cytidylate kinase
MVLLKEPLRVAVSGKSGCGNTTVSGLLAEKLGVKLINYTFRSMAEETGMTVAEIIEAAKGDDSFDRRVDSRQVELAMEGSCVLGSRLAVWMLRGADFRVYLKASERVRARRVHEREGGKITEIERFTALRDGEDSRRYRELYGIDNGDTSGVDEVIDTDFFGPEAIVDLILEKLRAKSLVAF